MSVYNVVAKIDIDGTPINNFVSLHIAQRFNEHHEFHIRLPYDAVEKTDSFSLETVKNFIGKVAVITLLRQIEIANLNEFKGIVTDITIEQVDSNHSEIILRGYSPTILLEKGPHTTCFTQKDLNKIVTETTQDLAGECPVIINPVSKKNFIYFTQYQESNFEFLNRLSSEFGEWFYYNGKELIFGKPSPSDSIELIMGEDVTALQLKLQMAPLSSNSYTYNAKDDTVFNSTTPSSVEGLGKYGKFASEESDKLFTPVTNVFVRPRVDNKAELDNALKIRKSANAAQLEILSGISTNPGIIPGVTASIIVSQKDNFVQVFTKKDKGKYLITSVVHNIWSNGKYTNKFEGVPSTIEILLVRQFRRPFAEPQLGIVKDHQDPEKLGRVKVQLMWHRQGVTTDWIRVMTQDAGSGKDKSKNRGMVTIPEIGDQVLVNFRYNDPDRPFVMGSLFHGKTAAGGGENNNTKSFISLAGSALRLKGNTVELHDPPGNKLYFDGAGNVSITASESITLNCGSKDNAVQSSITLKSDGTITIECKKDIILKAKEGISVTAETKDMNLVASSGKFSADAPIAETSISGLTLKLTGSTAAELKAALVKINS